MNDEKREDRMINTFGFICFLTLGAGVAMLSWPWAFIVVGSLGLAGSVIGAIRR